MFDAFIVALAYWVLILVYRFGANSMADQPIVVGPIIGLLLGNLETGVLIGASLQVIYLGVVNVGGAQSTDTLYATCMAVALASMTNIGNDAAIALSIPLGYIGLLMLQVTRIFFALFVPMLDRIAESGNDKKYAAAWFAYVIIGYGLGAVTIFAALAAGADATQAFIDVLPAWVMGGLKVAAGLLPAIGLGIILNMMWDNTKIIYFILGFALVAYLSIPTLCMAIIGIFLMINNLNNNLALKKLETNAGTVSAETSDEEDFFNE